jgi:magnesium transporter
MSTILFEGESAERLDSFADRPRRLNGSMLLWVDLRDPSRDDVDGVAQAFGLDDESVERLLDPSDGVSFRDRREYIHVTASAPGPDADSEPSEIECVVGDNWVVTAHQRPAAVLDQFAELTEGSGRTGDLDGPMFLAGLLEWVLDEHSSAFERIEEELEQVDSRGMRGESDPEDEIEHLVSLRLDAGKLRRSLVSHRSLLLALAHPELEALGDEDSARRFERLVERYERTLDGARDIRESIYGSFDVLIARTGHRTNEIVKVLTLASVIFLPGALIAGIMGMNFKPSLFTHPCSSGSRSASSSRSGSSRSSPPRRAAGSSRSAASARVG